MAKSKSSGRLSQKDFDVLADFRYQLRRYLRFSEEVCQARGITALQYQLLLQIKGYPGREWATITELAERLQSHHHGVVNLVERCEKAGLVQRRRDENDARFVRVQLLPMAELLLEELSLLHKNQLLEMDAVLTVPGRSAFTP